MKEALITGVTGQDGSYLAELLLEKGYRVDGLVRRISVPNRKNTTNFDCHPDFNFVEGDLEDPFRMSGIVKRGQYDEVYNLGAMSFVHYSFQNPTQAALTNYLGNVYLLEAIKQHSPHTRFYQASTSEMYGGTACPESGYDENSAFHPRSPYGVAKLAAYWNTRNARDGYGIFACNGILFNHEGPRRGSEFVTQKIVEGAVKFKQWYDGWNGNINDVAPVIELGNINAWRDWGHAKDYVYGMYLMLQPGRDPDDYVLATGEVHSVREFAILAFAEAGFDLYWEGENDDTGSLYGIVDIEHNGESFSPFVISTSNTHHRPTEVDTLIGNSTKARENLEWEPQYEFKALICDMYQEAWKRRARPYLYRYPD
jgi:GDPmannose 4,6-dehydratase